MDKEADTAQFQTYAVNIGDTIFYSNGFMVLDKIVANPSNQKYRFTPNDTALMADIKVITKEGLQYPVQPVYYVKNNQKQYIIDTVFAQSIAVGFSGLVSGQKIELQVKESAKLTPFVALKVYQFPFINVLWMGTFIMIIGFIMSIYRRIKILRSVKKAF